MRKKKPRIIRPDRVDADEVKSVVNSRAFRMIQQRIMLMRGRALADLIRPVSEGESARLRGFIEAVDKVLGIPAILVREGNANPGGRIPEDEKEA